VTRWLAPLILATALAGCATTSQVRGGFVAIEDSGQTVLSTHEGTIVRLIGDEAEELATIPGANVKVEGVTVAGGFKVRRYQILDVGTGFFAYVGWVVVDQTGCWLRDWRTGRDWALVDVNVQALKELHGAKIWISGIDMGPRTLRPLQWGLLRPATND
jgi:hypothetical protein